MATLIAAPPLLAPRRAGAIENTVPVIDGGDPHIGQGTIYERDVQISAATWTNYCETPGAAKEFEEIQTTVTGIPFTLVQGAKCRMVNEWASLGDRLGVTYERGEWRALEQVLMASIAAGDFCALPAAGSGGLAEAEELIWKTSTAGYLIMSHKTLYDIQETGDFFVISGDKITTILGTPVIIIPEAADTHIWVVGPITIWRGPRSEPHPVMEVPYINEFLVLTERVVTVSIECNDITPIARVAV